MKLVKDLIVHAMKMLASLKDEVPDNKKVYVNAIGETLGVTYNYLANKIYTEEINDKLYEIEEGSSNEDDEYARKKLEECEDCENNDHCPVYEQIKSSLDEDNEVEDNDINIFKTIIMNGGNIKHVEVPPDSQLYNQLEQLISREILNNNSEENSNVIPVTFNCNTDNESTENEGTESIDYSAKELVHKIVDAVNECTGAPFGDGDVIPYIDPRKCSYDDENPNCRIALAIMEIAQFVADSARNYDAEGSFHIDKNKLGILNNAVEKLNRAVESINE